MVFEIWFIPPIITTIHFIQETDIDINTILIILITARILATETFITQELKVIPFVRIQQGMILYDPIIPLRITVQM